MTDKLCIGESVNYSKWSTQQVAIPNLFIDHIDNIRLAVNALNQLENSIKTQINSECSDDVIIDGSIIDEKMLLEWSTHHLLDGKQIKINLFSDHFNIQQFKDPATITERQVISTVGGNYELGSIEVRPALHK